MAVGGGDDGALWDRDVATKLPRDPRHVGECAALQLLVALAPYGPFPDHPEFRNHARLRFTYIFYARITN